MHLPGKERHDDRPRRAPGGAAPSAGEHRPRSRRPRGGRRGRGGDQHRRRRPAPRRSRLGPRRPRARSVARRERRQRGRRDRRGARRDSTPARTAPAPSAVPRFRRSAWPPSRTRRSAWTTSAARNTVDRVGPPRPAAAHRRSRRLLDERPAAGLERRAPPRCGAGAVGCAARHRRHGDRSRPADEVDRLDAPPDRRRGGHDRPLQHPSRPELRHRLRPLRPLDDGGDRAHRLPRCGDARVLQPARPSVIRCSRSRSGS